MRVESFRSSQLQQSLPALRLAPAGKAGELLGMQAGAAGYTGMNAWQQCGSTCSL